jgi:hypothetical protein
MWDLWIEISILSAALTDSQLLYGSEGTSRFCDGGFDSVLQKEWQACAKMLDVIGCINYVETSVRSSKMYIKCNRHFCAALQQHRGLTLLPVSHSHFAQLSH